MELDALCLYAFQRFPSLLDVQSVMICHKASHLQKIRWSKNGMASAPVPDILIQRFHCFYIFDARPGKLGKRRLAIDIQIFTLTCPHAAIGPGNECPFPRDQLAAATESGPPTGAAH